MQPCSQTVHDPGTDTEQQQEHNQHSYIQQCCHSHSDGGHFERSVQDCVQLKVGARTVCVGAVLVQTKVAVVLADVVLLHPAQHVDDGQADAEISTG